MRCRLHPFGRERLHAFGMFEEAVERYYDSDERKAIQPEPKSFLDETTLVMVDRYR